MIERSVTCPIFVGRHAELAMFDDLRQTLASSRGSCVLVGGEPGIGKTRLVAQFIGSITSGRIRNIAFVECAEAFERPWGPIRTSVAALSAVLSEVDIPLAVQIAVRQIAVEPQRPQVDFGTSTDTLEKPALFDALVAFFELVARTRSTIVVIEDLHWADASTLEFFAYWVAKIATTRLAIVATYRPDQVEGNVALRQAVTRLIREPVTQHVILDPLSFAQTTDLIEAALGQREVATRTKNAIAQRCEGNPFFAEELLKSALARGTGPDDAPLPRSIRATILERLANFTDDDRSVLAHAAVLGQRFDPRVLAVVMARDVKTVLPALRRARDVQILVDEPGARSLSRFRHALTRRTIYAEMLAFEVREMHAEILTTLEAAGDPDRHIEELAYHAWEAKDAGRSRVYNERAGDAALAVRALPEAAVHYERALEAADDDGDRARLLIRFGCVRQLQGELDASVGLFEDALALRLARAEFNAAAPIVGWIVGDRTNLGDAAATARGQRFLREYGERLDPIERDSLAVFIARILSARYDFAALEDILARVSPEQLPPRARQNYITAQINRYLHCGDLQNWRRTVQEFNAFSATVPEFVRCIALYTIAQTGTFLGAHIETEQALDEADRLVSQWGFGGIDTFGIAVRAGYEFARGDLVAARASVERVLEAGEPFVARVAVASIAPLLALALDDDELATRSLPADIVAVLAAPDGELLCAAHGAWLGGRGRPAGARRDLQLGLSAIRAATPLHTTLLLSVAQHLEGDDVQRVLALTEPDRLHADDLVGRATAAHIRAIVAHRADRRADAVAAADAAAAMYTRLGWPLLVARVLEITGRCDEACAIYERCGATGDLRRLTPPVRTATRADPMQLSARENSVAQLVTLGLTNVAIAGRLAVSVKTVEKHLTSIFSKRGIRSRAQIAAFITREAQRTNDGGNDGRRGESAQP